MKYDVCPICGTLLREHREDKVMIDGSKLTFSCAKCARYTYVICYKIVPNPYRFFVFKRNASYYFPKHDCKITLDYIDKKTIMQYDVRIGENTKDIVPKFKELSLLIDINTKDPQKTIDKINTFILFS